MYTSTEEIAEILLKYSTQKPKEKLQNFLEDDISERELNRVLQFIKQDGYDIENFGIYDISENHVYCFYRHLSVEETELFWIYINNDGEIIVGNYEPNPDSAVPCPMDSISKAIILITLP